MPKVGVLADLHLTDEKPKSRLDEDFFAHQTALLESAYSHFEDMGVVCVVQPGDVLDKRRVSNRVQFTVKDILGDASFPTFCTLGQHDVRSHNTERYTEDSDVAVLEKFGVLKVLKSGIPDRSIEGLELYGFAWAEDETEQFLNGSFDPPTTRMGNKRTKIAMVHASVGREENYHQVAIADLVLRDFDWAVFGDIHQGFDPHQFSSGCVALNVGVLTPMAADEAGYGGVCAVIDTDENTVNYHRLHNGDLSDLFRVVQGTVAPEDTALDFKERLQRTRLSQSVTDEEIVAKVAQEFEVSAEARTTLLDRMRDV